MLVVGGVACVGVFCSNTTKVTVCLVRWHSRQKIAFTSPPFQALANRAVINVTKNCTGCSLMPTNKRTILLLFRPPRPGADGRRWGRMFARDFQPCCYVRVLLYLVRLERCNPTRTKILKGVYVRPQPYARWCPNSQVSSSKFDRNTTDVQQCFPVDFLQHIHAQCCIHFVAL